MEIKEEQQSAKPLPVGKDAVGGGSGFSSSVAAPATTPGEVQDIPRKDETLKNANEKVATQSTRDNIG